MTKMAMSIWGLQIKHLGVRTNCRTISNNCILFSHRLKFSTSCLTRAKREELQLEDEEFRVLVIPGHTKIPERKREERREAKPVPPPRYKAMKPDQDWTSVWPAAHTFKWSVVPFPVRQGFIESSENDGVVPSKYANAELMKIPNFLHLTPVHIKKHCAALKKFCNPWPEGLETDEDCSRHFPVEVTTSDYVTDSPSIRDIRARNVTVKLKLSLLELDYHARDKFLRLAGKNYDDATDTLTLEVDRCPLKRQNYDYAMYLLTALYNESWKTESWEAGKALADMEKYFWDLNPSRTATVNTLKRIKLKLNDGTEGMKNVPSCILSLPADPSDEQIVALPEVQNYKSAVEEIHNEEENINSLDNYKKAVKQLLLSSKQPKESDSKRRNQL